MTNVLDREKKDNNKFTKLSGYTEFKENKDVINLHNKFNKSKTDNITLKNSILDKNNRIYTTDDKFKSLKSDNWVYKDEKLINGGKGMNGINAFDNNICTFASLL